MAHSADRLPIVGPTFEHAKLVHERIMPDLNRLPHIRGTSVQLLTNILDGRPVSREFGINAVIDPDINPEQLSGYPRSKHLVRIEYQPDPDTNILAGRPAFPDRGE